MYGKYNNKKHTQKTKQKQNTTNQPIVGLCSRLSIGLGHVVFDLSMSPKVSSKGAILTPPTHVLRVHNGMGIHFIVL